MKRLLPLLLVAFLALPAIAFAGDESQDGKTYLRAQIIDKDPKGTNLRDAPKGKVIYTVALKPKDESERVVSVLGQQGEWFQVTLGESEHTGWMHSSVLGVNGTAEDGYCPLKKIPNEGAPVVIKPKEGAVLQLIGFSEAPDGVWIMVRYTDAKGAKHEGWIPQQCQ